jgi:hypothetical protein
MEAVIAEPNARQYPADYVAASLLSSLSSSGLGGDSPSQLDSIETTADNRLPSCYNEQRFSKHLVELEAVKQMYSAVDKAKGSRHVQNLEECRKYAWFAANEKTGQVRVIANACHQRWCPVCADAKRMSIKESVSAWIKSVKRPKFLTLTVAHTSNPLDSQIEDLYRAFRLLRKRTKILEKIRGGVWFFQCKLSKNGQQWHPHLHIALDSDFIDKRLLSLEWFEATGNSYIIDIRAIKDPRKVAEYVSRYCAKPCSMSDFTENHRLEVATVLHGKRLCGTFGTGAQCHLKTGKCENIAEWHRLGNWTDIIINRYNDSRWQAVIKAWATGEGLERDLLQDFIRAESRASVLELHTVPRIKNHQLCIEEFVKKR